MYVINEKYKEAVDQFMEVDESQTAATMDRNYREAVTRKLVENQMSSMRESHDPVNVTGSFADNQLAKWDPVMINMVRRSTPNLISFDLVGMQPMTGPTGLIFCMRSRYTSQTGGEALYNEANTAFSGAGSQTGDTSGFAQGEFGTGPDDPATGTATGTGMTRQVGEVLGTDGGTAWNEMAFSIEKTSVEAKTRALKASFTREIQHDLRQIHGLDAEEELGRILSTEIQAETNREIIRTVNVSAKLGAQGFTTPGSIDVSNELDGRWAAEKWRMLAFQIEIEANAIAQLTRRGRGNRVLCSANVASCLAMAGVIDHTPKYIGNNVIDPASEFYAGVLLGRFPVYIDPYATTDYITVGYRGANAWDAGIYHCPYVMLEMARATDSDSMQPVIGFKTRYGIVANPFATIVGDTPAAIASNPVGGQTGLGYKQNVYYRKFRVTGAY